MIEEIKTKLAHLDDAKAGKEVYTNKKQDLMNSVITDEIKEQIKDIEAEFAPDIDHFDEVIAGLEVEIKEMVVLHGESVKGEHMMVSFNKGRSSWDGKKLEGFFAGHPEYDESEFRTFGQPYGSIKNI